MKKLTGESSMETLLDIFSIYSLNVHLLLKMAGYIDHALKKHNLMYEKAPANPQKAQDESVHAILTETKPMMFLHRILDFNLSSTI